MLPNYAPHVHTGTISQSFLHVVHLDHLPFQFIYMAAYLPPYNLSHQSSHLMYLAPHPAHLLCYLVYLVTRLQFQLVYPANGLEFHQVYLASQHLGWPGQSFIISICLLGQSPCSPTTSPGLPGCSPGSKELAEAGRFCSERLTVVFMSWLSVRGEDPSQLGSSQLRFPDGSILVGLVGALMARSYIWRRGGGTRLEVQV